ncbi:ClbS/DfsB family four-helix bundle protein [Microbacterium sp. F51-2R]|jgi:hypothetical protein|uniref:ClbS/DfsB family four-helix bundle protein n=1 Tax=Microbacterium sp. F51-2R TaxID=3445777 RepID=UPI003F9F25B8
MATQQRDALIQRNDDEFAQLKQVVAQLRDDGRIDEAFAGDARDRNVRDVLAHLLAWHLLLEGWYEEGMIGGTPAIPADGYTWRELDALNVVLRDRYQHASLAEIEYRLDLSHAGLQRLLRAHSDEELFDEAAYPWTVGSHLGEFCLECGGNHYAWAREAIMTGLAVPQHP